MARLIDFVPGIALFGFLLFIVGLPVAGASIISAREIAVWLRLKRYGKTTQAVIEDLHTIRRRKGLSRHIEFSYTDGEANYFMKQTLERDAFERFQKRKQVTIAYLPNFPAVARLAGDDEIVGMKWFLLGLTIIFTFALYRLFGVLWALTFIWIYCVPQSANSRWLYRLDFSGIMNPHVEVR